MERVVIFGDLHGHLEKAMLVWDKLANYLGTDSNLDDLPVVFLGAGETAERNVVWVQFLYFFVLITGDYCDRGPQSRETFDWLVELKVSLR